MQIRERLFLSRPAERARQDDPGADAIPAPVSIVDLAISIAAPPDAAWPWLAQMGADRAGWYSYDRLDNGGHRSPTRIDPGLQDIAVGTVFPALPGAQDAFVLTAFAPDHWLLLAVPGAAPPQAAVGSAAWCASFTRAHWFGELTPKGDGTRVFTRARLGHLELKLPGFG